MENFLCPRRNGIWSATFKLPENDSWRTVGEDKVCSFCGSMSPEDFEKCLDLCIESKGAKCTIEQSDKNYKVYVTRPEIPNASVGAIKFYKQHLSGLPQDKLKEFQEKYAKAATISIELWHSRFALPE